VKEKGTISKADRAAATTAWLAGPHVPTEYRDTMCQCSQYQYPHPPHENEQTIFDYHISLGGVKH
jgi:hypothetical protein